jgi:2-dehydro-3-deoxyphosphogalactonate aldolase
VRLIRCECLAVANPPPSFGGPYFLLVRLEASGGAVGWGEIYGVPFHPRAVAAMVEDVFTAHLRGEPACDSERLFRIVRGRNYSARPDPTLYALWSGIEMALLDLIGREAKIPIFTLLGGRAHERLRCYTYLYPAAGQGEEVYDEPEAAAERAVAYVQQGWTALKFDPVRPYSAFDPREPSAAELAHGERYLRLMREAVGEAADLLVGTHGQFTPSGAVRFARRIAHYDPLWFEEPVPPGDPGAMAEVARACGLPVATGERLVGREEFLDLLERRAVAVVQPAAGRVGGLVEARKIAAMAETRQVLFAPHFYAGPVEWAANLQLAASCPNTLVVETIADNAFFYALVPDLPRVVDGFVVVPERPGLGVTVDETVVRAHAYQGQRLQLQMADQPVFRRRR